MVESAYIHIPFCKSKCKYCSFVSFANQSSEMYRKYVDVLLEEVSHFYQNEKLKTLYFGGGTPSLLSLGDLKDICSKFNFDFNAEKTIEINPETVDWSYLKGLREIGFNRLSIGVQSFDDEILKKIGRIHTSEKAVQTIIDAQNSGFENISVDFIYGLPNQSLEGFVGDLQKAVNLGVSHISLYGLKIEEGCAFYKEKLVNLPDSDMQADMYLSAIDLLENSGFEHYEISNFCKRNCSSKHNLNYWSCGEYYGFGLGAHGYVDGYRYENLQEFSSYFNDYKTKISKEKLTKQEMLEEFIFLGLRKKDGIDVTEINKKFLIDFEEQYNSILNKYIETGHLLKNGNNYSFSNEGFLLSNVILADFI